MWNVVIKFHIFPQYLMRKRFCHNFFMIDYYWVIKIIDKK